MNQIVTEAIILSRIEYGEADRILTLLTPDHGKLSLMAKGVRRVKSKLAGGIELFSISTITFVKGRGEVGTLVSTRLIKHYNHIVEDLERTMLGYELIKDLHKNTEDHPEAAYFDLLKKAFEALDDSAIALEMIRFWFTTELLRLAGHTPNLKTDGKGAMLNAETVYEFSADHMCFIPSEQGKLAADHIKFLRLAFAAPSPKMLVQVQGYTALHKAIAPLIQTMRATFLRV